MEIAASTLCDRFAHHILTNTGKFDYYWIVSQIYMDCVENTIKFLYSNGLDHAWAGCNAGLIYLR